MIRLWKGYVKIRLTGYSPERFLNLCKNNDIDLYSIQADGAGYIMEVSIDDFFLLKKILRKTGTKIHILSKFGLPFILFRYRKHKFFAIGIGIAFLCLILMSQFLWEIEISGNYSITDSQFSRYLHSQNIKLGTMIQDIDCAGLENQIRNDYPDIAWVSVQTEGTRLIINIQELKKDNSDIENTGKETHHTAGTDLIASNSGTITSIVTRNGTSLVKVGDQVEKGTVLVSGYMELYDDFGTLIDYVYCDADADVIVATQDNYQNIIALEYNKPVLTGKNKTQWKVIFPKKTLSIGNNKNSFENSFIFTQQKKLTIGKKFIFPVEIIKIETKEITLEATNYTEEEIKEIASRHFALYSKKIAKKGFQIIDKNVKIKFSEKQVLVSGTMQLEYTENQRQSTPVQSLNEEEGLEQNGIDSASNGNSS